MTPSRTGLGRSPLRTIVLVLGLLSLLPLGAVLHLLYQRHRAPVHETELIHATWKAAGGQPCVVTCYVSDAAGKPISNIPVYCCGNSGYGEPGLTDPMGRAIIRTGEPDLQECRLLDPANGPIVLQRPYAYWVNEPWLDKGLELRVTVKSVEELLAAKVRCEDELRRREDEFEEWMEAHQDEVKERGLSIPKNWRKTSRTP